MLRRLTAALSVALFLLATPVSGQGLYVGLAGGVQQGNLPDGTRW